MTYFYSGKHLYRPQGWRVMTMYYIYHLTCIGSWHGIEIFRWFVFKLNNDRVKTVCISNDDFKFLSLCSGTISCNLNVAKIKNRQLLIIIAVVIPYMNGAITLLFKVWNWLHLDMKHTLFYTQPTKSNFPYLSSLHITFTSPWMCLVSYSSLAQFPFFIFY